MATGTASQHEQWIEAVKGCRFQAPSPSHLFPLRPAVLQHARHHLGSPSRQVGNHHLRHAAVVAQRLGAGDGGGSHVQHVGGGQSLGQQAAALLHTKPAPV
jgi:hypothetical protein